MKIQWDGMSEPRFPSTSLQHWWRAPGFAVVFFDIVSMVKEVRGRKGDDR